MQSIVELQLSILEAVLKVAVLSRLVHGGWDSGERQVVGRHHPDRAPPTSARTTYRVPSNRSFELVPESNSSRRNKSATGPCAKSESSLRGRIFSLTSPLIGLIELLRVPV